jgi:hypothetical protein
MEYEDVKKSKFNAGMAHAERTDMLQRSINSAKYNPLQQNFETGTFNYEIMITSADNKITEGWDYFSDKERKEILSWQNTFEGWLKTHPIVSTNKNGERKLNIRNYEMFKEFFRQLERKIQDLYGKHNLGNPAMDDDEGL